MECGPTRRSTLFFTLICSLAFPRGSWSAALFLAESAEGSQDFFGKISREFSRATPGRPCLRVLKATSASPSLRARLFQHDGVAALRPPLPSPNNESLRLFRSNVGERKPSRANSGERTSLRAAPAWPARLRCWRGRPVRLRSGRQCAPQNKNARCPFSQTRARGSRYLLRFWSIFLPAVEKKSSGGPDTTIAQRFVCV
jgi:hypothetical protein